MRRVSLSLLAVFILVTAFPGLVAARGPSSERDQILAYWTPQRIANAKPKDYVMTPSGSLVPRAKPGGGGGGASTGASWTLGGAINARSGRVLFHQGSGDWICSASVVNDGSTTDGYSMIVTAGHCAYDGTDGWATNWMYIPDFDAHPTYTCGSTTYGCWTARALAISPGFYPDGFGDGTVESDWAFAVVGPGGKSGTAQLDALGSYALKTTGNTVGASAWAFGYPAAGKYHGKDLVYCNGSTVADPYGAATWGLGCDMTGGSSGGPWLVGNFTAAQIRDGSGAVGSVNSYGYSGLKFMFGPRFNSSTQATFNAANATAPDAAGIDYYVDGTRVTGA
jgi:V8-like Glu-specific endopeptidase